MLIDSTHKKWFWATSAIGLVSLALYVWLNRITPGGLTGGSAVGLGYGVAGSLLMIYAGLLSALRKVPSWWWVGARQTWMRGHIWLGFLSVPLILCHSGFRLGGLLERLLLAVFALTILTGVIGLLIQQVVPRMLTYRIPNESPFEQFPHLCQVLRQRSEELLVSVWESGLNMQASMMYSQEGIGAKQQFQEFYDRHIAPFLTEKYQRTMLLATPLQAESAFNQLRALPGLADSKEKLLEMEKLCQERRYLGEQERLHYWLHGWLLLHVPFSLALLVLGLAHAIMALYY